MACEFLKNNSFFSHIVLVDRLDISPFSQEILLDLMPIKQHFLIAFNLKTRNLADLERLLAHKNASKIDGIIFLNITDSFLNHINLAKKAANKLFFCATSKIEKINIYLDSNIDFALTQSFYSALDVEKFLINIDKKNKIIPTFLPFFSQKKLDFWRLNLAKKLKINIPKSYEISQNRAILDSFLAFKNLHISMSDCDFASIKSLIG